jgi:hypothetical protein
MVVYAGGKREKRAKKKSYQLPEGCGNTLTGT